MSARPVSRLIALLTDFGLQDGYVGIMKGVIAQINSQSPIIDITHQILPQDISAGQFCLMNAYPYFPPETVYISVIDPGVGSKRRAIAVQFPRGYYVGPDNGLVSGIFHREKAIAAVELTNPNYWRVSHPSLTFQGRDIFAPVGAYLATGVQLKKLGNTLPIEQLIQFPLSPLQQTETEIIGAIQYIDHFGNLIANIPQENIPFVPWQVQIKNSLIPLGKTYATVNQGELIAFIGSHGWLEIAVNRGNAQDKLGVTIGDNVIIHL